MPLSPDEAALIRGTEVPAADPAALAGWYPVLVTRGDGPPAVWWRDLGGEPFTDPFFHDTLGRLTGDRRRVCRTPLAALAAAGLPHTEPTGFVFHTSRCGSTLLAQCLATLPGAVVLSEPPAVDSFLRHAADAPGEGFDAPTFAALVRALGRRRSAADRHVFVKFDAWHVRALPFVRAAFPRVPCLFLYRRPAEVLASHRRQRGRHMVPGLVPESLLGPTAGAASPGDLDGYGARVLANIYGAAAGYAAAGELSLLDYAQFPAAIWDDVPRVFDLGCSPEEVAGMRARAGFHAKRPDEAFAGDRPAAGTDALRELVDPHYAALDRLRRGRAGGAGRPFPDRLRLPFAFDPARLLADLRGLAGHDWVPHFVRQNYAGDWAVLPLRGPAGATHPVMMIYSDPACTEFADTPLLAASPYFREVLAAFRCPLRAVRLMRLGPGSEIKEHRDLDLSFEEGTVRIHIPVATHPAVEFHLNEERVVLDAGSCWYLRLSDPHRVANRGDTDRVHLVIDAGVNDWLAGLFDRAAVGDHAP